MLSTSSRQAELLTSGQSEHSDTSISVPNNAEGGPELALPANEMSTEGAGGTATSSNHDGGEINPGEAILQDSENFDIVAEDTRCCEDLRDLLVRRASLKKQRIFISELHYLTTRRSEERRQIRRFI